MPNDDVQPDPSAGIRAFASRVADQLTAGGPPLAWTLRGYRRSFIRADAIGGVTVAALIIPLSIGYAQVAGLPPEVGLYASLLPLIAYAIFGSARLLIVGPDASTAALVAAAIVPLAVATDDRVRLAAALALLVAVVFVAMRFASLGFLADFLSRPILVGYMTGIGISVALNQVPKMLGGEPFADAFAVLGGVDMTQLGPDVLLQSLRIAMAESGVNGPSIVVAGLVLAAVLVGDRFLPGVPIALPALVAALVATVVLDLPERGVLVLGPVPSGLPPIALPIVSIGEAIALIPAALGIAVLSFADTALTGRSFAARRHEDTDPNRELVALAAADLGASLTSGYPISSSASRTAAVETAGATTQMAGVIAAGAVALVLLFLAGFLTNLPTPALGAVVFAAALRLIDLRGIVRIWRLTRVEGAIAVTAVLGVLIYGTLLGVGVAALLAAFNVFRRAAKPEIDELGRLSESGTFADLERDPTSRRVPGVLIVRFSGPLFFATATAFRSQVRTMLVDRPDARRVVIDAASIVDLDLTAAETLKALKGDLERAGVRLVVARPTGHIRDLLRGFGLVELAGPATAFPRTLSEVVDSDDELDGAPAPAAEPVAPTAHAESPKPLERHWSAGILLVGAVAVVAVLIAALASNRPSEAVPAGDVLAPSIVGLPLSRATSVVEASGLVMGDAIYVRSTSLPERTVTAQRPLAGTVMATGDVIIPTVSTGRDLVTVPDVIGVPQAEAIVVLTTAGLSVGQVEEVEGSSMAVGSVVATNPAAGQAVAAGTTVDLTVAGEPTNESSGTPP